jgi:hypothetical protein
VEVQQVVNALAVGAALGLADLAVHDVCQKFLQKTNARSQQKFIYSEKKKKNETKTVIY